MRKRIVTDPALPVVRQLQQSVANVEINAGCSIGSPLRENGLGNLQYESLVSWLLSGVEHSVLFPGVSYQNQLCWNVQLLRLRQWHLHGFRFAGPSWQWHSCNNLPEVLDET